jgi:aromatic ring-opening dioxygenase catalytic subunit (LigB family)
MKKELPQPSLYIPHGGGPCFFMEWTMGPPDMWDGMAAYLRGIAARLPARPKAILVVSAHWECPVPTVTVSPSPPLLYDYYNFPPHTYRLHYPAPGSPELAGRVRELLGAAAIPSGEEAERGLDHGVFVPLLLMFPEAEIPVVQLSLQAGLDPASHLAIGRALAPLRAEGVLIVGSGLSYHNLGHFLDPDDTRAAVAARAFDDWLFRTVTDADPAARDAALRDWAEAPGARACHPHEEHLIPLMVAAGAAGADPAIRDYAEPVAGKAVSGFRFG